MDDLDVAQQPRCPNCRTVMRDVAGELECGRCGIVLVNGVDLGIDPDGWRTEAHEAMATSNARTAVWAVEEKLTVLRTLSDDRLPHHVAAAIAECCWWLGALDELVIRELSETAASAYKQARNNDSDGRAAVGAIWARNRHSHQLVLATHQGDERPFFSKRPDVVVFISRALRWEHVSDMGLRPDELRKGEWAQPAFAELFEGRPVLPPLEAATRWFLRLAPDID